MKNFDEFVKAVNSEDIVGLLDIQPQSYAYQDILKEKNINLKGYIQYIILSAETISNYSLGFIEESLIAKL